MLSRTLGILEFFVGFGAVFGGGALILEPSGAFLSMPLTLLEGTPFRSFLIPGLVLCLVVGGGNIVASVPAFRRRANAAVAGLVAGAIQTGWISIQIALIGYLHWAQPLYLGFGLLTLALAAALYLSKRDQDRQAVLQ